METKEEIETKLKISEKEKDFIEIKISKKDYSLQHNYFYKINNKIVRVRHENENKIVCIKGKLKNSIYNKRDETEFYFDGENFFNIIGIEPIFYYSKERLQTKYKNCTVCLDCIEGNYYLEIEGETRDIGIILNEFGLDKREIERKSYFEILGGNFNGLH